MLALERARAELGYVDLIEAAHVDGEHVGAVLRLAAGEGLHTAGAAEDVMNDVFVEPIIAAGVQAVQDLKCVGLTKVSQRPCLEQMEQLQAMAWAGSVVASKRTRPQWQPPV